MTIVVICLLPSRAGGFIISVINTTKYINKFTTTNTYLITTTKYIYTYIYTYINIIYVCDTPIQLY